MRRGASRTLGGLAVVLLAAAALPSCAPRPTAPAAVDRGSLQERFLHSLAARSQGAGAAEVEASVWVRSTRVRDLPGVQARVLLAAPDAFRMRFESAFGTALDLGMRGDSLTAYVPARRLGMALDEAGESLGVRDPGAWAVRVWSAGWRPEPAAWQGAEVRDSLLVVRWSEPGARLEMEVGSSGLPRRVTVAPESGRALSARYDQWRSLQGVTWPVLLTIADEAGELSVTARVHRVRFDRRADPERLRVDLPAETERVTLAWLKGAFERMGNL